MMVKERAALPARSPLRSVRLRTEGSFMTAFVLSSCLLLGSTAPQDPPGDPPDPQAAAIVASVEKLLADAIAKAEPSVVTIARTKNESGQETLAVRGRRRSRIPPLGFPRADDLIADSPSLISFDNGAGVVIGDRGEILTLFHVVRGAQRLHVRAVGKQMFDAEIIAADPRSDLAVIVPTSLNGAELPKLKPIKIGDSGRLRKGAFLIALGNSFNAALDGTASASWGILSNTARRLEFPSADSLGPPSAKTLGLEHYPTLLQLDTKLNLGMSGGAVINLKGELVGITTMASSPTGFDAMAGYAVPMDRIIRRVITTLKEGKEVEYGLLGIHADPKSFSNFVYEVQPNSPAALGQLQINDQIIAVSGTPVTDFDSLILAVSVYPAGDTVRLTIRRGDETLERTIVLAKLQVIGEVIATNRPKPWRGLRVDYTPVSYRAVGFIGESAVSGVVVVEVEEGSPAAAAGLKRGQSISKVGEEKIRSPREFAEAVARHDGPVTLDTDLGQVTVK
jgi:serine protease Do